jgi:hypothetical protein
MSQPLHHRMWYVNFQPYLLILTQSYQIERPKVIYNAKTEKYVMWFHLDSSSYSIRYAGIAISDTPTGRMTCHSFSSPFLFFIIFFSSAFTFVNAILPDGQKSLDMTLYQDEDGSAYHVFLSLSMFNFLIF